MLERKRLFLSTLLLAACSSGEPKLPTPEGIVVLEVPTASGTMLAAQPKPSAAVATPEPPDLESCIAKVRENPFPNAPASQAEGEIYLAALAAERRGDVSAARKLYFDMIQRFSTSPYLPLGYFAFGELFRAELGNDPTKIEFAVQSYDQTLKYPASQNPLWEVALLRKAELSAMKGDGPRVMASLHTMAKTSSSPRCVEGLARAAEDMLPTAYAASSRPEKAASFFATFGIPELTERATTRLARLYISQQKNNDALAALRGLANSNGPGGAALCGEAVAVAQDLGDRGLVRDLAAKCNH